MIAEEIVPRLNLSYRCVQEVFDEVTINLFTKSCIISILLLYFRETKAVVLRNKYQISHVINKEYFSVMEPTEVYYIINCITKV